MAEPKTTDLPFATSEIAAEMARWLAHLGAERRMSGKTLDAYQRDVHQFLAFLCGHLGARVTLKALARLAPADVRAFMAARRAAGIGSRSLMRTLAGVRSFARYLEREGKGKVAALAAVRAPKVAKTLPKPLPIASAKRIADTDLRAAAKGLYVIRDFTPDKPRHGYVIAQGSSSTVNLVKVLPKLEAAGVNVKVIAAISEELFDRQPQAYRDSVLPPEARYDLMVVSTGTRRMWPLRNLGPLTDEYSLTSDFDNTWRSGGLEADVIAEAHLDPDSIFAGVERFANERERRIGEQRKMIG